jgi:hypothetical protein
MKRNSGLRNFVRLAATLLAVTGLAGSALAAMQRTAYPPFAHYASGRVMNGASGFSKHNADLLFGKDPPDGKWQGFVKFDLSEIPDNAYVTAVSIGYEVISASDPGPWTLVRALSLDPAPAEPEPLWNDITGGTLVTDNPVQEVRGWVERPLNSAGVAAVQAALGQRWVAFGLHKYDDTESKGHAKGYESGRHKPYLKVTFAGRDLGVTAIDAPFGNVAVSTEVTPSARINNHGDVDGPFRLIFTISRGGDVVYQQDLGISSLPPGNTSTFVFPPWNAAVEPGELAARVEIQATGDAHGADNSLVEWFNVVPVDRQEPVRWGWEETRSVPLAPSNRPVRAGGWLALDPASGDIYAGKGNKTGNFYRFDPLARSWQQLAAIPAGPEARFPGQGAGAVVGHDGYLYMVRGNNTLEFWRYSIAADNWELLTPVPAGMSNKRVKGGTDLAWVPQYGTGYVYVLKGNRGDFMRYDVEARTWENLASAPVGASGRWEKGSWLVYDDNSNLLAHRAKFSELWMYDVVADHWETNYHPGMPLVGSSSQSRKSKDGGSAARRGSGLFALKGNKTGEYWHYDPFGARWREYEPMPEFGTTMRVVRVGPGADIVSYPFGRTLFALKGNKTVEFWRYTMAPEGETEEFAGDPGSSAAPAAAPARPCLQVSPNPPLGGIANLNYSVPQRGQAQVRLFDAAGRVVNSQSVRLESDGLLRLDVGGLSAGIYLIRLDAGTASVAQKLIINR